MSHNTVIVLNPVLGGSRYVSPKLARQWVLGGMAHWADQAHFRVLLTAAARVSMAGFAFRDARDAALGYDGVLVLRDRDRGPLTVRELAAIPVANPKKLLGVSKARRKNAVVAG